MAKHTCSQCLILVSNAVTPTHALSDRQKGAQYLCSGLVTSHTQPAPGPRPLSGSQILGLTHSYPPSHTQANPRVTAVARKRSRSLCQKCGWQVTAKHACTSRMWLCMKWHGAWLYGVHRTCAETAAVSCGTSHASAVSTVLWWILKKTRYKKLVTHVEPHASAVSLLKRAENSAI